MTAPATPYVFLNLRQAITHHRDQNRPVISGHDSRHSRRQPAATDRFFVQLGVE